MRRALYLCTLLLCFSTVLAAQSSRPDPKAQTKPPVTSEPASVAAKQAARAAFAELPLSFEENRGQSDARVKYLSRGAGYNLFLTGDEAVISLHGGVGSGGSSTSPTGSAALWLKMLGGNSSSFISSSDLLPGKINYYIGNDPSKWRTGVRQYGRVTYRSIYPGVDLTYYGNQRQLESDFVVSPGANPQAIEFEIRGARETRLDAQGNLVLVTDAGNAQLLRPGIYQMIHGVRHDVPGSYKLRGNADGKYRVGFEIAKFDTHSTLIIDPTLVYSTYVGGSSTGTGDGAQGIAVDASGHAWITGSGSSTDFPGSNIGPPNPNLSSFAFVTELDQSGSSGTSLVYSTIIAGSNSDQNTAGNGISIDGSGNAYIAGTTSSTNFPLLNPFQGTFGGASQSGIVVGLMPGGTLLYSTYFGGRNGLGANGNSDVTILNGIYADPPTGNTYVVGNTTSANFPTINPLQSTLNVSSVDEGLKNVVVAKFNPQGQPVYSTYLNGTNSNDSGNAIVADANGNAYITGQTVSGTFPIQTSVTPFQKQLNSTSGNAFVTKLSFSGSALTLAGGSFLGGAGVDQGWGIAIDSANPPNIYVTGQTTSVGTGANPFPTKNPISGTFTNGAYSGATNAGGTDAFVTKISGDFATLVYSTFLGGLSTDVGYAIALDNASPPNAYVTGSTGSSNFPVQNPLQSALGNVAATNAFVAEISGVGTTVNFSTFLGGISGDVAHGIALDSTNDFYIAGKTNSANFPVMGASGANPFQGQLGTSTGNAFVAKFSPAAPASALTFFPPSYNFHTVGIGGTPGFATEPVTLTNNTGSDVSISALVMGGVNSGDFTIQSASPSPCSTTVFPFTLTKGSSCTLLLRFTPSDQDTRSATLSVTSNASSSNVLNLTGSGGAPQVSFSPATLTFFPNPAPLNVEAEAFVTVTNSGGGPLTIGSAQISAADAADAAPFSILSGCASTTLNPGSSCSIEIAYTPTTATTSNATLLLNTNAAGSPQTLPLTGTGVAEVIVQPTSIEYMQQIVGTSVANAMNDAREYIVENGSGANITLTVTPGTSASQGDFQIENESGLSSCVTGLVLAPGGECETLVFFLPTAVSGVDGRTGSYKVAWNGPIANSQVVNLMGQGVTGIFLLTNTITAANEYVGFTEGANTLEALFNGTSNPITVSIALTGNNPSDFAVSLDQSCAPNNVVPANTFCRVNTSFTPSALGLRSVTALFDYTGDGGDPLSLTGSGTGIPGPVVITVANRQVSTFDFGSEIVNTTTPETRFLVRNVATVPATISSITPPGNSDFKFTSDSTCAASGTLQGGSSCFIGVTFSPSSVTNPPTKESTTFTFSDTYAASVGADASSPHTITVTGTGEPSLITISVSTGTSTLLDFGTVNLKPATPPIAEIFLTNASNTATVINWSGGSPALDTPSGTDFSFANSGVKVTTCTNGKTVLPQGGSCQIAIQFNPQTAGEQTNSVTFTDQVGANSPTMHKVMIQGNSVGQGQVSMTSTLTYTQLINTTSGAQTTTVTNTGAGPLTITQTVIDNFGTGTGQFNILPSSTCAIGTTLSPTGPGNACLFNITFAAPATAGLSEAEIEVEANIGNNGTGFGDTFLEGTAVTGGLALSPAGTINFGTAAVGTTTTSNVSYSLTNNNAVSVTMGTISVPSGYAVIADGCSSVTVMAGSSCDFDLTFTPTSATSFNGNLSVTFTGAGSSGSPFSVAIQGSGSSAVVANPNPAVVQFASVNSQTFVDITIENGSASAATITGVSSFTGANPGDFSIPSGDNFCPNATVLSGTNGTTPGGSCFIEVAFLSLVPGNFGAQFNVSYSIGGVAQTPVTVVLTASIPAVQVTISPSTLTFPSQTLNTQSQVKFVTITNTSAAGSSLYFEPTNIQITGNDFAIGPSTNGSSCSFVQPGASCTLPIIFTPSSRDSVGPVTGTLSITANTSPATQIVTLNGTASLGAVTTETTNMSFPTTNVGSSTAQAIVLSNTTSASVTLSSLAYTGPYGPGTGPNACASGTIVPATSGTCLIYVKFTPTGGATSGTLIVSYNGSVALPTINLTGSQSNPIVSLTPSPTLTFPTVLEGSSVTMTATLTNGTASGITISSTPVVTTPGNATGDFTFASNTCTSGAPVASGGGFCTIGVKFAPLGLGSRTATLSVTDSEGTHTIGLSGTGTTPATITATGGATQSVPVNTAFTALQATVKDANLNTLQGVSVTFTAPASGASGKFSNGTNTITITTDANGVATATFTANSIPTGTAYTVTAAAGAVGPANFTLTNLPGTPASITATAGTPQSAAINVAFTTALQATVKDGSNLPLDGVSVTFTAPSSGASGKFANNTNTVTVTTDVNGIATATAFTANSSSGGPYTVTATAGAFTANFMLTNLAGAPAFITATQGASQSTTISTPFPTLMQATVKDAGNNLLSGATVTFTVVPAGNGASGTLTGGTNSGTTITETTNASGVATAPVFTANSTAGAYTVNATVSGVATPAQFSLTNNAGPPASIVTKSGTPQSIAVNTAFPSTLQATVTDGGGNPVSGVSVTFTAPASGASGTFAAPGTGITAVVTTNSSGVAASPIFTSNSTIGSYSVNATVSGVSTPAAFSMTNVAGPPSSIVTNAGTPQNVAINTPFPTALQAKVTDSGGNPVSGASVTFTAPASGASGTFAAPGAGNTATVTTNSSGLATAPVFTSNSIAAAYSVNATVTGVATPAAFSLTNNPGPAAAIVTNAGTSQSIAINTAFPTNLQAKVTDSGGNPVSGASVTFTAPATGASGTFAAPGTGNTATVTTNASGLATAPVFTSNATAAAYTVNATVTGVATPAAFSLTNTAGPAKTIVTNAGTPQNVAINTAFPTALQAKVTDSGGNPVSGASVTFTAPASGASGTFAPPGTGNTAVVTTNSSGLATAPAFTSNSTAGAYTVNATVTGVTAPAAFSLTNNVGPAASIAANAGTPQSVAINTAFATALQAKVTDSGGNPVSGASVTFTAPASGASGTFAAPGNGNTATVTTNSNGLATAPTFTANSISGGPYTVGAATGTLTAATFSLTNLSAPPAAILATTGSGQSAVINVAFTTNLQATVNDSGGHPIAGASVTFTAPATGASGTFASPGSGNSAIVTTNASGVATAPVYTANGTAGGPYNVTATAGTVSVNFSMTNLVGPPSTVTASAGTPQNVTISATYPTALKATVKDSGGNLLNGIAVTFTAPASGASGTFAAPGTGNTATAMTVNGVATAPAFSANTTAGSYLVNATVSGVATPATFSLTNNPGPPATIITNGGTPQSVAVNTAFATMQVAVKDGSGNGVSGVSVTFTAPASGPSGTFAAPGSGNVAVVTTNASGVASAPTFTANNTPGGSYTVTAGVSGLTAATFTLTNLAGTPASIVTTSGTPQSVAINTQFAALTATVKDSNSIPLSGVIVTFTAPASGPSGTFTGGVTVTTAMTNTSGLATAPTFTANATAGGPYNVGATAGTLAAVNFSLTNLSGPPSTVTATAGTPQSVAISTLFPVQLQATVKDNGGNLLSGVIVTFTAPGSGASGTFTGNVTALPVTTNASGVASAAFTANSTVGAYMVNATVSGVATPAAFSLTNTSGPPATIVTNAGTPQNVTISTAFTTNLQAKVTDSGGNPVSGASVTFTAPASGASGAFAAPGTGPTATVTTNSAGLATAPVFTANGAAGAYTVNATVTGVAIPAAFSLTNNAGPPATVAATAGTPQSVAVTLAFPTALQATVKDSGGNLISGVSVTFTAPSSGASGTFTGGTNGGLTAVVTTNSSGIATAPAFTANATGGIYNVNATVTGVATPAVFALTNTVSPDVTIAKSHTGDFLVGANDTYSIKLTNNGTGPTTGTITVTDALPTGLTFVSGAGTGWSCSAAAQLVTCTDATVGALAAKGGTSTITLTVSVGPTAISSPTTFTLTNSAAVSDPGDLNATDKSSTDAPTQIDNAVPTQTAFSPAAGLNAGATSAQTITLTGTGFNSSTLVTIGSNPALTGTANAAGTSLTITVPVADLATAGNVTISVTNPANPNSHNGGGTAPANQTFPLVGVIATQDPSTSGTIPITAGTPAMVKIDFTTNPANSPLPSAITIACQVPMALTGLTCVPGTMTIAQGSTSGSSTITLNGVPISTSRTIPVGGGGPRNPYLPWLVGLALAAMAGMIVTSRTSRGKGWQVRRAPAYATLLLLVVTGMALVGCTTASSRATPTPTGPASVVVTATAADGATSSVTVQINVSN